MHDRDLDLANTALMLVDLQNDFLEAEGAYGRAGQKSAAIAALPQRLAPVADAMRAAGGWIVATQFTLVPGKNDAPFISTHLQLLRPFLGTGDFAPGSWGQELVSSLQPADLKVEKVAYSAFYMSRLDYVLQRAGIETLIFSGIVTNGGVASTLRDAHVRDYQTYVLSDGCAAFSDTAHQAALADMASITSLMTCAQATDWLRQRDRPGP